MILACGEALIDLLVGKPSSAGLASEAVPGGSPFNVAIGVALLGGKAGFLSKVSEDFFGRYLVGTLAKAGVDERFLVSTSRQTTLSVAVTGPGGEAQYAFYRHDSADRSLLPSEIPPALPDEVSAITIGSYTLAIDPTASAIEHLIERESGGGRALNACSPDALSSRPASRIWRSCMGQGWMPGPGRGTG